MAELTLLPVIGNGPTVHTTPARELFALLSNAKAQGRPRCWWNEKLAAVAQRRAEDMATRNYFSHETPDKRWPNQIVREAGYKLPHDWPDRANYVESIAAGYETADKAWAAWMKSPSHKIHLLGSDDFYAAETNVGVGYYKAEGSAYGWYWVVMSCPPE